MIKISNIEKTYGKLKVLQDVNLEIGNGKITAVLGPNGSGKTTLLKSILGMVLPNKGQIIVNGWDVRNNWEYRSAINYIPQISTFPENLTIEELMKLLINIRGNKGNASELIEMFGLEEFMKKRVKHLSGGTKQKANIMLACMFNNDIIIMDEPTSGLDPISLLRLKEYIRKQKRQGKTILLTTHIMSVVEELADEIIFLLEGKVHYQGGLASLNALCGTPNLEHSIAHILKGDLSIQKTKINGTHVKSLAI